VPAKTLRAIELERRRLGRSRSSVVAEALDVWLEARSAGDQDRRYLEGYALHPEPEEAPVAAAVMAAWTPGKSHHLHGVEAGGGENDEARRGLVGAAPRQQGAGQ
jgi:hypothetical protein